MLKTIALSLPTSLGEIINIKHHLDLVKHQYDSIRLNFNTALWKGALHTEAPDWPQKEIAWKKYLNDIGALFFSKKPYSFSVGITGPDFNQNWDLKKTFNILPQKPELGYLLCRGASLNLGEEYIVITTKIREMNRNIFFPLSIKLWNVLNKLSQKYKIVVLGEREVEMRREYQIPELRNAIFGIYEQIISNVPNDRIVDLTVPALGENVTSLEKIQQDCLIMKEAKFVITLGIGGNFCMATSVSNMVVGFRKDSLPFTDAIFNNREYPNAIVTKDWNYFIQTLEKYIM
jgi:hypothetical protein